MLHNVLGFGSLMSEASARTTFPALADFRIVRVGGWRRVFAHAAAIFFDRGIANKDTMEFASLSAEPCEGASFLCCSFTVEMDEPNWERFREREEEFQLLKARAPSAISVPSPRTGPFTPHARR